MISTDDEGEDYMQSSDASDDEKIKVEDDDDDDEDDSSDDNDDGYDPQNYGAIVHLGVPARNANRASLADSANFSDDESDLDVKPKAKGKRKRSESVSSNASSNGIRSDSDGKSDASDDDRPKPSPHKRRKQSSGGYKSTGDASDADYQGDESDESYSDDGMDEEEALANNDNASHERKGRRRYKRLDSHSRDGRWYPSYAPDNGDDPMEGEDETWNDLKDVVSSDPLYQIEGGVSITSRLRSSVLSQDMNIVQQSQVELEESPLVPFGNIIVPTDVTPTDEIAIIDDYDAKDEVSLL